MPASSFESFPNCILQDPNAPNFGRSTFGESHYLDDASGDRVYAMRHIEAELSAYGEACRRCVVVRRCAGLSYAYAKRYGVGELTPSHPTTMRGKDEKRRRPCPMCQSLSKPMLRLLFPLWRRGIEGDFFDQIPPDPPFSSGDCCGA